MNSNHGQSLGQHLPGPSAVRLPGIPFKTLFAPRRLGGFAKVFLEPGEKQTVEIHVDPRLLGEWYADRPGWTHAAGAYTVTVGHSSRDLGESLLVELPPGHLPPDWTPAQRP